jgi:hypothetical protein
MTRRLSLVHGAVLPTAENVPSDASGKTFPEKNFESSWGETRTPDPGIMSAVL